MPAWMADRLRGIREYTSDIEKVRVRFEKLCEESEVSCSLLISAFQDLQEKTRRKTDRLKKLAYAGDWRKDMIMLMLKLKYEMEMSKQYSEATRANLKATEAENAGRNAKLKAIEAQNVDRRAKLKTIEAQNAEVCGYLSGKLTEVPRTVVLTKLIVAEISLILEASDSAGFSYFLISMCSPTIESLVRKQKEVGGPDKADGADVKNVAAFSNYCCKLDKILRGATGKADEKLKGEDVATGTVDGNGRLYSENVLFDVTRKFKADWVPPCHPCYFKV